MIEKLATIREKKGVSSATVSRLLALIRFVKQNVNGSGLVKLGSWASFKMVLRYAHLNSAQLRRAAEE